MKVNSYAVIYKDKFLWYFGFSESPARNPAFGKEKCKI